ncbi:hypothetical protein ACFFGF_12190 [Asaia lannensis]|uniref:hypothetical protein n=1 Tax=Asaia lannensis TaxID=415421 RepID=UPI0035EAC5EB
MAGGKERSSSLFVEIFYWLIKISKDNKYNEKMSICIIFDSDDIVFICVDGKTDYILVMFMGIGHEESA